MWYLVEDFLEQSWVMKLFILLGWLCVGIMVSALIDSSYILIGKAMAEEPVQELME
jgi:hypothetical protein